MNEEEQRQLIEAYANRFFIVIGELGVQMELGHPDMTTADIGKLLERAFTYALSWSDYDPEHEKE